MKLYSSETLKGKLARREKLGKVLGACFWVVAALAAACVCTVLVQKFVLKKRNVDLFGYTPFIISSGSMQPSLRVYDIVVVKKISENEISVGDIITFFDADGAIVTHRVAAILSEDGKTYYTTKGDANNVVDPEPTVYENIIGRYGFAIAGGGRFVVAVTSPAGISVFVLLFVSIGLLLIRNGNRKTARHSIREKYKQQAVQ